MMARWSPTAPPPAAEPLRAGRGPTTIALTVTLSVAALAWFISVMRMRGMDMGVGTDLGPLGSFCVTWLSMMAAMMLPGAAPAVVRLIRAGRRLRALPLFLGSYLAVWVLVGIVFDAGYRPHTSIVAGVVVIAAGLYELTPLKRLTRECCHQYVGSGLRYGLYCVASSGALMSMLMALGPMSLTWMCVIGAVVLVQKLLPQLAVADGPTAAVLVGLGVLILMSPDSIPGLVTPM